jgi:hypothetical protein
MSYRHRKHLDPKIIYAVFTAVLLVDFISAMWVAR